MIAALHYIFNWKKNPYGVFYIASPLVLLALSCALAISIHHWRENGDPVYAIIFAGAILIGFVALYPVTKRLHDPFTYEDDNDV